MILQQRPRCVFSHPRIGVGVRRHQAQITRDVAVDLKLNAFGLALAYLLAETITARYHIVGFAKVKDCSAEGAVGPLGSLYASTDAAIRVLRVAVGAD